MFYFCLVVAVFNIKHGPERSRARENGEDNEGAGRGDGCYYVFDISVTERLCQVQIFYFLVL